MPYVNVKQQNGGEMKAGNKSETIPYDQYFTIPPNEYEESTRFIDKGLSEE